jgi:transposase
MRSRIEPMKKIAWSLRQHREPILNYFRAQELLSSGVVERNLPTISSDES